MAAAIMRPMVATLDAVLCFCAGVFLHICVLHFFRWEETSTHPMVRMWKRPRLASTVWASVQLFAGVLILLLIKFRFALDLDTLVLLAGFCF